MAQSPAHHKPNNNPPMNPLETGVQDNSPPNGTCPSQQSSAPVGPDAPERSADGNLDAEAKNENISTAVQSKPSGASLSVGNRQVLAPVGPAASPGSSPPSAIAPTSPKTSTRTTDGKPEMKDKYQNIPTTMNSASAGTQPSTSNHRKRLPTQNRQRAATNCDGTGSCTCGDCVEAGEVFTSGPGERVKMTRTVRLTGDQSNGKATEAAKKARVRRDFFHGLPPGSDKFMSEFIRLEVTLYSGNNTFKVHVLENGMRYKTDLGDFGDVYKFKNKKGLEMKAPLDFAWETITVYIDPETVLGFNYSNGKIGDQLDNTTLRQYLKLFEISAELRRIVHNSITLEFSGTDLGRNFTVPLFVTENSMIQELENTLNLKLRNPEITKEERERLEKLLKEMPQYTKFLIMSQAKSFTDVHFDFSGTSVYYHVFKGQKIFYIAPPTPENLEIYKTHKERGNKTWMGSKLSNQWQRIVINEGETAMIPGGYLHFVYTPVDSLVIGGNFLMKKYAKLQFQCTEHEESLLPKRGQINTSHLFEGFRNAMWLYLEYCLLPLLKQSNDQESVELGRVFAEGCNPEARCLEKHVWYTKEEKKSLHSELKTCLGSTESDQPSTSAASNPVGKAPRKQKQIPETSEQVPTSVALDSDLTRKQKAPRKKTIKNDKEGSLEDVEETGSEATAPTESSSTTLPSKSRSPMKREAGSRRPAKPSTSADANSERKRNECNDSMEADQEEEVLRTMKASSHSSTFPLAPTLNRQNREVPRTTSHSDEKEPGPVEKQMEAVQKENVKVVMDDEEMNRLSPSASVRYSDMDDYDTGSYGQQKMDLNPVDNQMEVVGEENDTVTPSGSPSPTHTNGKDNDAESRLASITESYARKDANKEDQPTLTAADLEKAESFTADSTKPASFLNTLPNDATTSVPNRLLIPQQDETEVMKAPETEQEKLSSNFSDPKMTEPKPNKGQIEEVQVVQERTQEKQETTPSDEPVQSVSTLDTSSNSVIPVVESSLLRHSATQTDDADVLPLSVEKAPELNKEALGKVPNVHAKTRAEQEATSIDENILPTSSSMEIGKQVAASASPISVPPVPTTDHQLLQNMPTSSKLLSQQELSGIALLPQEQPSQSRELLIAKNMSLLKEKRQALSAIVMQDLDDTQLMQIAASLHSLSVSAPMSADIAESGGMVSVNEKSASHQPRNGEDQVENEETAAADNEEVVDSDKEKRDKQSIGSVASDPAEKEKDQVGQEEDSASRKNDADLLKNALYNHFLLHQKIISLPITQHEEVCRLMSSQMMVVEKKFVQRTAAMAQEAVSSSSTSTSVAEVLKQHHLLINGIESLTGAKRARAYKALALQMATVQELVEDEQETMASSQLAQALMEKEAEEKRKKRTADGEPSTSEPATKKMKSSPQH